MEFRIEALEEIPGTKKCCWKACTMDEHDHPPDLRPVRPYKTLRGAKNYVSLRLTEEYDYACYRIVCPDGSYVMPWRGSRPKWMHIVSEESVT